jgi:hypothetical protein
VNATRGLSDAAVVRREDPDQTTGPLTLAAPFEDINIRDPLRFPMSRALIDKVRSESEPSAQPLWHLHPVRLCPLVRWNNFL